MKLYTTYKGKITALAMVPALLLFLVSCGSYQYQGYGNDGIYGDSNEPVYTENNSNTQQQYPQQEQQEQNNAAYYENLFGEKSEQYASVPTQGAIFTDVDAYSSAGSESEIYREEEAAYDDSGYGPWGSEANSVSINYYDNYAFPRFYYPAWNMGWNYGYGFNPYWGGYYNNFGWGWGGGFGYNPYYFGGFYQPYGFAYNYPYYYAPYNHPRYFRNNVAYNVGRRGTYSNYNNYNYNSRSSVGSRNSTDYRSTREPRRSDYGLLRGQSRTRINNSADVRANSAGQRSNRTYNNRTNNRSNEYQQNTNQRRNNTNVRSSSPSRSSGSYSRGSSGGGRSSGGMRSGGRGGR